MYRISRRPSLSFSLNRPNRPTVRNPTGERLVADDLTTKHQPSAPTTKGPKQDFGSEIDAFVQRSRTLQSTATEQRGRLIFAMDATASQIGRASCRERV